MFDLAGKDLLDAGRQVVVGISLERVIACPRGIQNSVQHPRGALAVPDTVVAAVDDRNRGVDSCAHGGGKLIAAVSEFTRGIQNSLARFRAQFLCSRMIAEGS